MVSASMVIGCVPWKRAASAIVVLGWEEIGGRDGWGGVEEDAVRWGWEVEGGGLRCWLDIGCFVAGIQAWCGVVVFKVRW